MMLFFRKKYKAIFGMVPLVLLYRYDLVLYTQKMENSVGEVFLMHVFGGSYNMEMADITLSMLGLVGIIYLSLLFADYMIRDLQECAEYIFSRYQGRRKWYGRKVVGLFFYCNIGIILYLFLYFLNAIYESERFITEKDIFLILCTYVMVLVFSYCLIIFINLCSLYYDASIGFIISYSIVIISSMGMILIQKLPNQELACILHRINPMSNVLVSWNFSDAQVMWGLGYYMVLAVFLSLVLWKNVKNYEIGIGIKSKYGRKYRENE